MLALSTLHTLLSQVLSLPDLHTAILHTPGGQLVSFASDPSRSKDDIHLVVGVSWKIWQENAGQGCVTDESEVPCHFLSEYATHSSYTRSWDVLLFSLLTNQQKSCHNLCPTTISP